MLLISPLLPMLHLMFTALSVPIIKKRDYTKMCEMSISHQYVRLYMVTFEYVFLSIFIQFSLAKQSIAMQLCIGLLSIATLVITDYHLLEIVGRREDSNRLVKIQFPNKLIDSFFYAAWLVASNLIPSNSLALAANMANLIRLIYSVFNPYYSPA